MLLEQHSLQLCSWKTFIMGRRSRSRSRSPKRSSSRSSHSSSRPDDRRRRDEKERHHNRDEGRRHRPTNDRPPRDDSWGQQTDRSEFATGANRIKPGEPEPKEEKNSKVEMGLSGALMGDTNVFNGVVVK